MSSISKQIANMTMHMQRIFEDWFHALVVFLVPLLSPLSKAAQAKAQRIRNRQASPSDRHFQDLIQQVQNHQDSHFRLCLDCDDLLTADDSCESQWNEALRSNAHITRVTITISEPFALDSSAADALRLRLNRLLQGVGNLPNLKELCLSDIFDDDEIFIFSLSLVTEWLQQAKKLQRLKFHMAHLSLTEQEEDLVQPFANALRSHPSLTALEFDHCTYHADGDSVTNDDQLCNVFVQSAQSNWNLQSIVINSSSCRRHPLQDTIDFYCKMNRQRKEWYANLYHEGRCPQGNNGKQVTTTGTEIPSPLSLLDKIANDLDSTYYYLSEVNPQLLTNIGLNHKQ